MNDEQMREYGRLCREMRAWPAELVARLGNVPPIGLHFFIWREIVHPTWYCGPGGDRPLENPFSDKFQAANEGRAAQAIGGSEKWDKLPGDMGRIRFFGRVSPEELDRVVGIFMEVFRQADETITKYTQLRIHQSLHWRANEIPADPDGHRLTAAHHVLGIICLTAGYDYDDIDILVQEDERLFHGDFTPYDQDFIHTPCDGIRIGTDVYALHDVVARFAEAVNEWVPEDLENISLEMDEHRESVEEGECVPPNVFRREDDVWRMRYESIEDKAFPHSDNFEVISRLLRNPDQKLDSFELQGIAIGVTKEALKKKRSGADVLIVDDTTTKDEGRRFQGDPVRDAVDPDTIQAVLARNDELRERIDAAKEKGRPAKEIEDMQDELKKGEKYLSQSTYHGQSKTIDVSNATKAYRTVRKAVDRATSAIRNKMPCFAQHLDETIHWLSDKQKWVYSPGEEIHWVVS